jgi:hypothetical protein
VAAWSGTELADARAITAIADRFVVVGGDGTFPGRAQAWTSMNGITWEPATVEGADEGTIMTDVASTPQGLVAFGTATTEGADGPDRVAAWHSTDGTTWESGSVRRPRDQGMGAGVTDLADGPGGTLALVDFFGQDAGVARIYRSTDGTTWEPVRVPRADSVVYSSLTDIPDGYLLIGRSLARARPSTLRSTDGVAWERVDGAPRRLFDAATGSDGGIVGITDRRVLRTTDLETWEPVATAPEPDRDADTPPLDWITWDGSQFAATSVSYEGCPSGVDECYQRWLLTSPDGSTWTESTGPDGAAGPDEATQMFGLATLGDTTVVLGGVGASPTIAWIMES